MKEFIEYIIKNLVDFPEQVYIKELIGDQSIILELHLNKLDIGKIIGKKGSMISALRTLCYAMAAKNDMRIILEIVE